MTRQHNTIHTLVISLLSVFFIVLSMHAIVKTSQLFFHSKIATDFSILYQSLSQKQAQHPGQITKGHSNLNTPLFNAIAQPITKLSAKKAYLFWQTLSLTGYLISVLLILSQLKVKQRSTRFFLFALAFIYTPLLFNIALGELGTILLLPTTLAWLAYRHQHTHKAACCLGFLACIKLFFAYFLLLFVFKRQWRQATSFLLTIACLLLLILCLDANKIIAYTHTLSRVHWYSFYWNASLFGFLSRLFGGINAALVPLYHAPLRQYACYALVSTLMTFLFWQQCQKTTTPDIPFSLTLTLMLLLSPLGWVYYFVFLLIPFYVILQHSQNKPLCLSLTGLSLFFACLPCWNLTSQTAQINIGALYFEYYFLSLLLLTLALCVLKTTKKPPPLKLSSLACLLLGISLSSGLLSQWLLPLFLAQHL